MIRCHLELEWRAIQKVAKWDFINGTYAESYGAHGEAKAAFGPLAEGVEVDVDTELHADATYKIYGVI